MDRRAKREGEEGREDDDREVKKEREKGRD
jgi:hypothetical protein